MGGEGSGTVKASGIAITSWEVERCLDVALAARE